MGEHADDLIDQGINEMWDEVDNSMLRLSYQPFSQPCPFNVGNIVVLITYNAHAPQEVMSIKRCSKNDSRSGWMIQCRYTREYTGQPVDQLERFRRVEDFKLYNHDPKCHDYTNKVPGPELGKFKFKFNNLENDVSKLYQTIGENPRFGTFLAKNSTGQLILEMKGESGKVEAFDPDKIEEVKPYTISVNILNKHSSGREVETHFECAKDRVREGDYLVFPDGTLSIVTKINTGFTGRLVQLPEKTRRFQTEEI